MVVLYCKDGYPEGKTFSDEHAKNLLNMVNNGGWTDSPGWLEPEQSNNKEDANSGDTGVSKKSKKLQAPSKAD